jgi:2-dehydropantoate 2-reductase
VDALPLHEGHTSMKDERILIVGTGAMACLFAARLAPMVDVIMLGTWQEGIRALREQGVCILESDGEERRFSVTATDNTAECSGVREALVLVKSWQTIRAANQLATCLGEEGIALTLQNGMGNLEKLQEALGKGRAALGVTTTGATLVNPGLVRVGGSGPTHIVPHERLERLVFWLRQAGFVIQESTDLESLVWGKLVVNAGINPLTATLRVPNGALLEKKDATLLMHAAAKEVAAVAEAKGVDLPFEESEIEVAKVAHRTAKNHSSMFQDILRGAPTEIDAICGAIVKEGRMLGVSTPVNETLWHLVRALADIDEEAQG